MRYNPKLGMWGNVDKALAAATKANSEAINAKNTADNTANVVSAQLGGQVDEKAAEQFRFALQKFAATLTEEQAMEVATIYDEWKVGWNYKAHAYFTFGVNSVGDPQLYKVVKDHTSQADWIPSEQPSLYTAIGLDDSGYPVWSQPTGAHDAYNTGDVVDYNGTLYESLIDGNTYSPEAYPSGWRIYES